VRALGAPHTTWIGLPSPVSTMHTRSRSAFGCFSAETTEAMMKGLSSAALSSTLSTSSPIIVSLPVISASDASVSRCSLSQARVNFMKLPEIHRRQRHDDAERHNDGGANQKGIKLATQQKLGSERGIESAHF